MTSPDCSTAALGLASVDWAPLWVPPFHYPVRPPTLLPLLRSSGLGFSGSPKSMDPMYSSLRGLYSVLRSTDCILLPQDWGRGLLIRR